LETNFIYYVNQGFKASKESSLWNPGNLDNLFEYYTLFFQLNSFGVLEKSFGVPFLHNQPFNYSSVSNLKENRDTFKITTITSLL